MTTKDDDTRTAKQREDEQRKQAESGKQGQNERPRSTRGEEVDPRTGRAVGEEYDPMQDPTFNKNEAQQFAESGHAGSAEAEQATRDAD